MDTKQKILNLYNNKYDHKKDRKIVNLLKFVLVDNEEDLFKLERLTPITQKTMMNYSYDEEYMLKFLTKEEYKIFIKKIEFILELAEKKEDIKDLYLIGQIIDELFNTRHKIEEVCSNNFFPILKFRKILADENFIDNNFGAGLKSKIKNRIAETTLIRTSVPKNQILIQDRFHLFVVKENIHYLNPVDYKKLKLASDYLCSGADLDFVVKKYNVYATSVIPILSDSKLKEILKENAYKNLVKYIEIDKCLLNSEVIKKQNILKSVSASLYKTNFDFEATMNYLDLPKPLFNKLLHEILNLSGFDIQLKDYIKQLLSEEKEDKKVK